MKPHFFGGDRGPLYGVYAEPRIDTPEPPAVLACYPIAGEYMRAHRAFRQLSNLLTRKGAHVMRFDYYATGDSFGGLEDMALDRWREDIATALEELQELCGISRVKLVGLRMGATLGLQAAESLEAIDQVVLWDPIVEGSPYVDELEAQHVGDKRARQENESTDGVIGVHGFPLPRALRDEIRSLDLRSWSGTRPPRVDLVVSQEGPLWSALRDHLASLPNGGVYSMSASVGSWGDADEFGSALIPQQIIQSVVDCLLKEDS